MFPSAPIFQQYNYFRQNLEEKSLSLSIFISFTSNFLCKILLDNKNIDANIWIFQIPFSQWRGGLWKKLFWGFFLEKRWFSCVQNLKFNWHPEQVFCQWITYFWQICDGTIFPSILAEFFIRQNWIYQIWIKIEQNLGHYFCQLLKSLIQWIAA